MSEEQLRPAEGIAEAEKQIQELRSFVSQVSAELESLQEELDLESSGFEPPGADAPDHEVPSSGSASRGAHTR